MKNRDAGFGDKPHEVCGILLYVRANEEMQPDQSYLMSGNRIEVRALDLNREFAEIAASLDRVVVERFAVY